MRRSPPPRAPRRPGAAHRVAPRSPGTAPPRPPAPAPRALAVADLDAARPRGERPEPFAHEVGVEATTGTGQHPATLGSRLRRCARVGAPRLRATRREGGLGRRRLAQRSAENAARRLLRWRTTMITVSTAANTTSGVPVAPHQRAGHERERARDRRHPDPPRQQEHHAEHGHHDERPHRMDRQHRTERGRHALAPAALQAGRGDVAEHGREAGDEARHLARDVAHDHDGQVALEDVERRRRAPRPSSRRHVPRWWRPGCPTRRLAGRCRAPAP